MFHHGVYAGSAHRSQIDRHAVGLLELDRSEHPFPFRTIDSEMTSYREPGDPELPPEAFERAGLHYAKLTYEEEVPDPWTFE